ncbi:MAG TPA: class I SAM-dependent methyltransferase [Acidimicrobiales bacterium]|nr:class I SAM-dependent methyltransferase [Acidimicrobiales bacterium]
MADERPKWMSDLLGWYAITTCALGASTGMLDALRAQPGAAREIAERSGTDERNTLEWLRAMAAAGYATYDGQQFTIEPMTSFVLGSKFPVDARAIVDFVERSGALTGDVVAAIRTGTGIAPQRFHDVYGDAVGRINAPIYRSALVDEWIGGCDGVTDELLRGGRIADLASGTGEAVLLMARAFPAAEVTAYDLDEDLVESTVTRARTEGLANVRGVAAGTNAMPRDTYQLVTCLDSFHHLGDPASVASEVKSSLAPGGVFMVAETASSGDLVTDLQSPMSAIVFSTGLMYCLQENLRNGGAGQSGGDGPAWAMRAFEAAGFSSVSTRESPTGFRVFAARR